MHTVEEIVEALRKNGAGKVEIVFRSFPRSENSLTCERSPSGCFCSGMR